MTRMVNCIKLKKEAEGLEKAPYPGELGQRILDRKSTRLNSSHTDISRMPSSA